MEALEHTQTDQTEPEARDYPRFTYIDTEDFPDVIPTDCPFCGTRMIGVEDPDHEGEHPIDGYCPSDDCPFHTSPKLREVYRALRFQGWSIADAAAVCLEHVQAEPDRFTVDSADKANWVLKKLAQAQLRIAEVDEMEAAEIEEIKERARVARRRDEQQRDFFLQTFSTQLEDWARADRENWGKAKSRTLIFGKLGFAVKQGRIKIDDEEAAINCGMAKDMGRFIITKFSIKPSEVKKAIEDGDEDFAKVAHIDAAGESFSFEAFLPGKAEVQ